MKWKTTLVLVVAFAALLAFTLRYERGGKTPEETARDARRAFRLEEKDVRSIRIVRPEGTVRLERVGGDRWTMTEPVRARADRWSAGAAAGALSELEIQRSIPNDRGAAGLEEMGLQTPRARVEFILGGAPSTAPSGPSAAPTAKTEPVQVVEFGDDVPATSSVFMRQPGKQEIALVASSSAAPFLKPIDDFRDRSLLDLTILDVAEAVLTRQGGEVRFRRRDEEWWMERPIEDLAAGDAVQSLLSAVIGLRAETFVDAALDSGLDSPRESIRLSDRKGAEIATVRLGDTVPGQSGRRYVRADAPGESGPVVSVAAGGLDALLRPPADFRSRQAMPFRSWEATSLTMSSLRATLAFQKKDGAWTAVTPSSLKVEAEEVEKTLQALSDLEISSFEAPGVSGAPSARGLDPPRARFEVSSEQAGASPRVLELGLPGPSPLTVYARDPKRPGLFLVEGSILQRIDGGASLYTTRSGNTPAPGSDPASGENAEEPGEP